jgi:hypothetical protein
MKINVGLAKRQRYILRESGVIARSNLRQDSHSAELCDTLYGTREIIGMEKEVDVPKLSNVRLGIHAVGQGYAL